MGDHSDIDHTGITGTGGSVATDAIWDAAGDLAVGSGANTAAKLTKGADGTVLTVTAGAVGWAAAGSASLTSGHALCSGDQALTTGATFTDIPGVTASLAAGTYFVAWKILASPSAQRAIFVKLWDGTTIYDEAEDTLDTNAFRYGLSGSAVFTLGSTQTVKLSASCSATTVTVLRNGGQSANHHPTKMSYVKIA